MSRKKIRGIIAGVSLFYVIVVVLAVLMLNDKKNMLTDDTLGERLSGKSEVTEKITEAPELIIEKETDAPTERITEEITEEFTEEITEEITEEVTEEITEEVTEEITEEVTEEITEEVTEEITEEVTEEITEEVTEEITEEVTEEVTEAAMEIIPETDGKYYVFKTTNKGQLLIMRESGSKKAKSIDALKSGTTGVVIELGDEWTKLYTHNKTGYCITAALEITEVTKEEFEDMVKQSGE